MKKMLTRLVGIYLNALARVAPRKAGRFGYNLFCTPQSTPVKDYHRKFLETAEQKSFECEGITIQTYQWGNGARKMLFVHGWQSHSFRWKNYIDYFSKSGLFTVYALDAPAHGLSGGKYITLPFYSRVIQQFIAQIEPVHAVVSHSFGSFAMLHALSHAPGLPVHRLVIMGTPGEADDFMQFYKKVLGLSARTMKLVLAHFESVLHNLPPYYSAARFAQAVTIPGLIVHDEHDAEAPYHYAQAIHAAWKNSTLITTSGLGHNLKSGDVMKQVEEFVLEKAAVQHSESQTK